MRPPAIEFDEESILDSDGILNLKQIPIKMHTTDEKILTLDVTRKGKVTASDLQGDSSIDILDADARPRLTALMGEAPMLEHRGARLTQSGVILDYLAQSMGRFGPNDVIPVDYEDGRFSFDRVVH